MLLVTGLVGVVPAVTVALAGGVASKLIVMLITLLTVGIVYLAVAYVLDALRIGTYVAMFVLSTFAANVPLAGDQYFRFIPGSLGPQVWLVQAPLLLLVLWLAYDGAFTRDSITRIELTFAAFVTWSVFSALLGSGPRTDIALYFSWLQFQAFVLFMVVRRGVEREEITLPTTVLTYAIAIVGHVAFSVAQLWTQKPIGVSYLGESIAWNPVSYPLLDVSNRVIVSGLTGHGYVLVGLVLLSFPGMLWIAAYMGGRYGSMSLIGAVAAAVILRLTTSDAGRGAFLILLVSLAVGILLIFKHGNGDQIFELENSRTMVAKHRNQAALYALSFVVTVTSILFPSNKSNTAIEDVSNVGSNPTTSPAENTQGPPPSGSENVSTNGSNPTTSPAENTQGPPLSGTTEYGGDLSVPFFNLKNLGFRFQQYVVGLDIFRRNPMFGIGGGNYPHVAREYGVQNKLHIPIPHALHNIYIMLLAETGLPGFLLYFLTVALVCHSGLRSIIDGNRPYLHLSVLAGLVAYLSFAFFAHPLDKLTALFPFWAFAAALVGDHRRGVVTGEIDMSGHTER
ncbi:O-antigen ligase family protein [Haloarchaeobius iranensis]|uniref:O-antigen ligase family protein n=1 Tax=Haloarchaeobius iranensis TaxID=996166 RepID=UPI00158779A7|nr:O-antigen ligase family protein [Haloarchaeobius iranensis]